MTFNGFFLLIGVVFCIEGVRGAASSFGFGDFKNSSTRPDVVAEHSLRQITGFQFDRTKALDFLKRTIGFHPAKRQSPVGDLPRKRERPHGEIGNPHLGDGKESQNSEIEKGTNPCGYENDGKLSYIKSSERSYLIDVCFDHKLTRTLFTKHTIRVNGEKDNLERTKYFKYDSSFFPFNPNVYYITSNQEARMNELLDTRDSSIVTGIADGQYFARGHLAPAGDFGTKEEADATYSHVNTFPQWQKFNNGNWRNMEKAVRNLASSYGTDFQVWTGTWGTLELDDINRNPVPIYLGLYENKKVLPVPVVMWKVVYDRSKNKGVGIIGLNDPYRTNSPLNSCDESCNNITWLHSKIIDTTKGPMYCCTVQNLRQAIPNAPSWSHHVGLLTD